MIGGEAVRLHLFVATLGYSRRCFVQAFRHERQSAWIDGTDAAFDHFGGVLQEVLLDNARALVERHDAATREVTTRVIRDEVHRDTREAAEVTQALPAP